MWLSNPQSNLNDRQPLGYLKQAQFPSLHSRVEAQCCISEIYVLCSETSSKLHGIVRHWSVIILYNTLHCTILVFHSEKLMEMGHVKLNVKWHPINPISEPSKKSNGRGEKGCPSVFLFPILHFQ